MSTAEAETIETSERVAILKDRTRVRWTLDSPRTRLTTRVISAMAGAGIILGLFFFNQPSSLPFIVGMLLAIVTPLLALVGMLLWTEFCHQYIHSNPRPELAENQPS